MWHGSDNYRPVGARVTYANVDFVVNDRNMRIMMMNHQIIVMINMG